MADVADSSRTLRIQKLKGREDYAAWAYEMRLALYKEDLWDCVENDQDVVALQGIAAPSPEQRKLIARDRKALALIGMSVERVLHCHIREMKTACKMWTALAELFGMKDSGRIIRLHRQLYRAEKRPTETMQEYLNHLKEMSTTLLEAGMDVSDNQLAVVALSGLPEEYDSFITSMQVAGTVREYKFDAVSSMLLTEEVQRKDRASQGTKTSEAAALAARSSRPRRTKSNVKCYNCGKLGHYKRECRAAQSSDTATTVKPKKNLKALFAALITDCDEQHEWHELQATDWLVDSGATRHMTSRKELFKWLNIAEHRSVQLAGGDDLVGEGQGLVEVVIGGRLIHLRNTIYVPKLRANLLSVSCAVKSGCFVLFGDGGCYVFDDKEEVVLKGKEIDGLYYVRAVGLPKSETAYHTKEKLLDLWHRRWMHINVDSLKKMVKEEAVRGMDQRVVKETLDCEDCKVGKLTQRPFPTVGRELAQDTLGVVHSDLCGPLQTPSWAGSNYLLTFLDDRTRYITVYFLKAKSEVAGYIKRFVARAERETGRKLKVLRTDNGLEFCNKEVDGFLAVLGVEHQRTVRYTPQQNGAAERLNRTLVSLARTSLHAAQLPTTFWAEAVNTAAYLRNRCQTKALGEATPFELYKGWKPSVKHLKVFGCKAFVKTPVVRRKKLDPRAQPCVMLGYAEHSKAYRLWDPKKQEVLVERDVAFFEHENGLEASDSPGVGQFLEVEFAEQIQGQTDEHLERHTPVHVPDNGESGGAQPHERTPVHVPDNGESGGAQPRGRARRRQPARACKLPMAATRDDPSDDSEDSPEEDNPKDQSYKPPSYVERQCATVTHQGTTSTSVAVLDDPEPNTVTEALARSDAAEWRKAMDTEYKSLMGKGTWKLVSLPEGRRPIKCKWVLVRKRHADGRIERYKARLVAKGCSQVPGQDFTEVYSPVAGLNTIRTLVAAAVQLGWLADQLDVVTAYLNGELDEEIYMIQPEGYVKKGQEDKVCRLIKSLYGLKQAGRAWNVKLDQLLRQAGFKRAPSDACAYRIALAGGVAMLTVYVDDIVLLCENSMVRDQVKELLQGLFEIKDLGSLHYILGMEFDKMKDGYKMHQRNSIHKLLNRYGMQDAKPVKMPLEPGLKLSTEQCPKTETEKEEMVDKPYRSLVGSLQYLASGTRPDIAFAVNQLAQYCSNPGVEHWCAAKRILRYLKGTQEFGIYYRQGDGGELQSYCDADWASGQDNRRSTTGVLITIGGAPVVWQSRKQHVTALSTMEAEYMAIAACVKELVWLRRLLQELRLESFIPGPTIVKSDSQAAISFANNRIERGATKHIDVKLHFVREKLDAKVIHLEYIETKGNPADILTKALDATRHQLLQKKLISTEDGS